ncbi:MAG: SDR family oxidoreductase [Elusimicrobiota bacterium]|nr:SDR family oxidoreductase [Elusimicrobiota bacterium]
MSLFLVTGGAGFIGSHIVDGLLRLGEREEMEVVVRVIDNFSTGKKENIKNVLNRIELIEGDIRDEMSLRIALKGVDFVLHQAALRSVPRSMEDPISTNDVNVAGTLLLLKLSKEAKVKRLIYASSSSVYGNSPELPKKELQLPQPVSPYAVSKLTGEYYCRVYSETFGLQTLSLRYFNVFGPRQDPLSQYAAVIPKFINLAINNKPFEIHGDGKQSRDFSYIDNVVEANILAVKSNKRFCGEVFNIACGKNYTILEVAKTIEKVLKNKLEYDFTKPRPGDVRHTLADISLAKKYFGYKVVVNFQKGMERTIKYFQTLNSKS